MKISIGTNIKEGPWGGGNLFAINLKNYLVEKGHKVVHSLNDNDIDIILITEPRRTSESSAFTHIEVLNYISFIKKDTLVVHRLNECDERKNTNYVNKYLLNANKVADHSIFVSGWLKTLYINQGFNRRNSTVIYAGADKSIFNRDSYKEWDKKNPLKIVTHHWGANWNKGFEYYLLLDSYMEKTEWKDKIEFTYIGNIPKNVKFKNSKLIAPLAGQDLAKEIKKNHLYITGSANEPSGNHHIEAAQCGLPILYLNSGGIPEYCEGFGIMFNNKNDFEEVLKKSVQKYDTLSKKMNAYPHDSKTMSKDFLNLFESMLENKQKYLQERIINLNTSFVARKIYQLKRERFAK